jgi:putative glutamine amidotransferase
MVGPHPFQMAGEKYVHAVARGADALPVVLPVLPEPLGVAELLASVDGLLFTGSPSNVEPARYGGEASQPGTLHDLERDATSLALIPAAVAAGVPVLGLCRGFQEMNVAYGGTLWQRVQELPGFLDHRENKDDPLDQQYALAHAVQLTGGGLLRSLADSDSIEVNSLHSQGIRDLAPGLIVEARAPDGLIEGFRVAAAPGFAVAVQWHPEWRVLNDSFSTALFAAFGQAARERAAQGRRS